MPEGEWKQKEKKVENIKGGVSDFCGAWISTDKEGEGGWRKSPHSEAEFSRRHLQHEPQRKEGEKVEMCARVDICVRACVFVFGKKKNRAKDSDRETEGESSTYREGN